MSSLTNHTCPAENAAGTEQSSFLDGRWDAHETGWVIAGVTAAVSTVITLFTVFMHARNYYVPKEQRQIIRILFMPAVYAVFSQIADASNAQLAAFLMLLLQYIGDSSDEQKALLRQKEKRKIPIPFCCIRFRPSKPYSLIRPLISIAEIICEAYGVYLDSLDFVSISVALYGLIVFYALVKERLAGKKPLFKFLSIKLIVMITFYQAWLFNVLESHGVITATEFWTATNVADGLAALCICCEMVLFSIAFVFAFSWKEYRVQRPMGDFIVEGYLGLKFWYDYIRGRPGTHAGKKTRMAETGTDYGLDMDAAFAGVEKTKLYDGAERVQSHESSVPMHPIGGTAQRQQEHYPEPERQGGAEDGRFGLPASVPGAYSSQQHQMIEQYGYSDDGYMSPPTHPYASGSRIREGQLYVQAPTSAVEDYRPYTPPTVSGYGGGYEQDMAEEQQAYGGGRGWSHAR
ncbi:SPOSA6832_04644 [Sporobolomyces salmonicolor]|uniref:SPOSA6832_04644-mRNA-1:cds n=1 Tax=Sporidiobolus salmonicolor TaxID=5005 RepID=A0A0D6ESI8_SPOSA|nr:SPOSA6832_04644 [Sporobolomyces salmonicolor]